MPTYEINLTAVVDAEDLEEAIQVARETIPQLTFTIVEMEPADSGYADVESYYSDDLTEFRL